MDSMITLSLLQQLIQAEDLQELYRKEDRAREEWSKAKAELEIVKEWFDPSNTADPDALAVAEKRVSLAYDKMVETSGFRKGYQAGLKRVEHMIRGTLNDVKHPDLRR